MRSSRKAKADSSVRYRQWNLYKKTVDIYFNDHRPRELFDVETDSGKA